MKTFKEAYGVLSQHAQALRAQQEPNIDDLLTIVTESVAAYKVCKERIDAVEAALAKALGEPEVESNGPAASANGAEKLGVRPTAAKARDASASFGDTDDDVPF